MDITSIPVLPCNFRNPSLFISAANHASKDVDIFSKQTALFKENSALIHVFFWV